MTDQFSRTRLLLGQEAMDNLAASRVAVFGVGGVGGYVCEALVRSGVGAFDLIDNDDVSLTNLNRQIIATSSTIGRDKTEVMKERMLDINPNVKVTIHKCFFLPENSDDFPFSYYDYVVDAVDTVTAKIEIIMKCKKLGIPVISSMGAGNKLDPTMFRVADIYKTKVCPLAKVMRRELKKRGVKDLKVVYSEEVPLTPFSEEYPEEVSLSTFPGEYPEENPHMLEEDDKEREAQALNGDSKEPEGKQVRKKITPGSMAFVPSVAGLIIASEVVKDLAGIR